MPQHSSMMQNFSRPFAPAIRARSRRWLKPMPSLAVFAAAIQGDMPRSKACSPPTVRWLSAVSSDGWTPLHLAAHFNRHDAARLLLNKGAEADARSTNAMRNTPSARRGAGRASVIARLLLDHGANANARQHGGWTPLHAAAQNGDIEFARILVEAGGDVNLRADNGQAPLDLALIKGQQAMVDWLEARAPACQIDRVSVGPLRFGIGEFSRSEVPAGQ